MISCNPETDHGLKPGFRADAGLVIRRIESGELDSARNLVARVVAEVYGTLFPDGAPEGDADWNGALVAVSAGAVIGVALTSADTIDDIWVAASHRRNGVGRALLASAEAEIWERGHRTARLRVVADNIVARRFYAARRWTETETYPHETWGFPMVDIIKERQTD